MLEPHCITKQTAPHESTVQLLSKEWSLRSLIDRLKLGLLEPVSFISRCCLLRRMSGILPFAVGDVGEDEDEDEKIAEAVKKGKWSFDPKAFSRSTSEIKDLITSLLSKDAR